MLKIWLHGSSLGDVNALRGIVHQFAQQQYSLIVSASTQSGKLRWESLLNDPQFLPHTHLKILPAPLWSKKKALIYLKQEQPDLLILELLELWPAWVKSWARAGVRIVVVDGRISKRTLYARFYLARSFRLLSLFLAQTPLDAERAIYMGCLAERVFVCGDAKFDSLLCSQAKAQAISDGRGRQNIFNIILACTRKKDEKYFINPLITYLSQMKMDKVLIAPRQLKTVPRLIQSLKRNRLEFKLLSVEELACYGSQSLQMIKNDPTQLWILNCYGHLSDLYNHTHCAVIGGTFYDHGQNLLEASQAGCAVIYGPRVDKQRAQVEMIAEQGGYAVKSWTQAFAIAKTLQDHSKIEVGVKIDNLLKAKGAVLQQVNLIESLFN